MSEPVNINVPPCLLPEDPHTAAQLECYADRCDDYANDVAKCIAKGGTPQQIQACIDQKRTNYLATLGVCDTL